METISSDVAAFAGTTNIPSDNALPFDVKITLSRLTYRVGGTIVGTVLMTPKNEESLSKQSNLSASQLIRECISSCQLCVVGYCRLDQRWHSSEDHLIQFDKSNKNGRILDDVPNDLPVPPSQTTPFWVSHPVIDLIQLNERISGKWDDVKPKPINLLDVEGLLIIDQVDDESGVDKNHIRLEDQYFSCTFRIDLPSNIPYTFVGSSCRYFYSLALRIQLHERTINQEIHEPHWVFQPITLLTASKSSNGIETSDTKCQAMAHSSGLPCYLTADELLQMDGGQYSVNRNSAAFYRHFSQHPAQNLQQMTIVDPVTKKNVCVLSIIGLHNLNPGSRLLLKLDFPTFTQNSGKRMDEEVDEVDLVYKSWILCYQASACLQGEEFAIRVSNKNSRTRAHKYLFATAHTTIDPFCIESISLDLMLPASAPCNIQTDFVEFSTTCIVDIAIGDNMTSQGTLKDVMTYRNIHLEIPCKVEHAETSWERGDDDDFGAMDMELDAYDKFRTEQCALKHTDINPNNPNNFDCRDIMKELKILSLIMADQCSLRPKPSTSDAK